MSKRYKTNKGFYLFNMILFTGFAFEFFIRKDNFLGSVLIFNGIINLLAYRQVPQKIASITVILNLFNALISFTISYNYGDINYSLLFMLWAVIGTAYIVAVIRQTVNLIKVNQKRKKQRRKIS